MANPLTGVLDLNGIALCTFSDLAVTVVSSGDVRALIYLHWDPQRAHHSTTTNAFYDVMAAGEGGSFRDAAWQIGTLPGDGDPGSQCDQTELFNTALRRETTTVYAATVRWSEPP